MMLHIALPVPTEICRLTTTGLVVVCENPSAIATPDASRITGHIEKFGKFFRNGYSVDPACLKIGRQSEPAQGVVCRLVKESAAKLQVGEL